MLYQKLWVIKHAKKKQWWVSFVWYNYSFCAVFSRLKNKIFQVTFKNMDGKAVPEGATYVARFLEVGCCLLKHFNLKMCNVNTYH